MHAGITWGLLGLNPNGGASRGWGSGSPALTLSWLLAGALSILAAGCRPSRPGPWHNYSLGSCGGLSGGAPEKVGPLGPWGWHLIWEKGLSRCQEGFLEEATLDCPGRPWVLDKCSEKRREGERHRETQRDSERLRETRGLGEEALGGVYEPRTPRAARIPHSPDVGRSCRRSQPCPRRDVRLLASGPVRQCIPLFQVTVEW